MKTLQPLSSSLRVPPRNGNPTEFEIQARIYSALRQAGIDCRGEIQWKDRESRSLYRFDIVIYVGGEAVEIIEVKAAPIQHRNGVENTRQGKRYRNFGVPVTFVYGLNEAEDLILERIKAFG